MCVCFVHYVVRSRTLVIFTDGEIRENSENVTDGGVFFFFANCGVFLCAPLEEAPFVFRSR